MTNAKALAELIRNKKFIVWGLGSLYDKCSHCIDVSRVIKYVDQNPVKVGTLYNGIEVISPDMLSVEKIDYESVVIIVSSSFYSEISAEALALGFASDNIISIFTLEKIFFNSGLYWERRYAIGGSSGVGSYDKFAEFKSSVINDFVESNHIDSIIEYGCGDGNQLAYANYNNYTGVDVSESAVAICKERFREDSKKTFLLPHQVSKQKYDLSLSLDVIYHLVEDSVFESYMFQLFDSSSKYVIIYSSNFDDNSETEALHVKHRQFTSFVEEYFIEWKLVKCLKNIYPYRGDHLVGSFSDFFIFEKIM